jgi:dienelactone hydrolase
MNKYIRVTMLIKLIIIAIAGFTFTTGALAKIESLTENDHLKYSSELTIVSHSKKLPAVYYGAAGKERHPTIILLHGYPGNEKNLDIAQGMRDEGWNVLFFNYRGSWGAEGEFSFINAEEDVTSVIQYLSSANIAEELNINIKAISLIGHSMGGHMAISGLLDNPEIKCSVSYDGANIGDLFVTDNKETKELWRQYGDTLFMLRGWTGNKSLTEPQKHQTQLNLINRASKIQGRSVLMIPADSEIIPILQIEKVTSALRNAGGKVESILIKDDHSFNNNRKKLLAVTQHFMKEQCI